MIFQVSKTYEVITPESAEYGETEEKGFEYQDREFDLRELLEEIKNGGFVELSSSNINYEKNNSEITNNWISTVDAEQNYLTGSRTYYGLHVNTTGRNFYKIAELAGLIK